MKISVVIPCYNAEKYLSQTLTSINNQTCKPYEILLIDDCSTDNSISIAKEFDVNIHSNPKNMGIGYTRQLGLDIADGDYVAYLSADDTYHPKFIEKSIKYLKNDNGTYTDYYKCDENLTPISLFIGPEYSQEKVVDWVLTNNMFINFSSIIMPKNIPVKFVKELRKGEDLIFLLDSIIKRISWNRIKHPLIYYRMHKKQGSFNWNMKEYLFLWKYLINRLDKLNVNESRIIGGFISTPFSATVRVLSRQTSLYNNQ